MITKDKVTEIFCIIDEFNKNLSDELLKNLCLPSVDKNGIRRRNRLGRMSESEIMTVLVCYHFGTYSTFKDYYLNCIKGSLKDCFPDAVSYNRFVELMPRVFLLMMLFMKLYAFGKCTGITFVDSTMIPVCHNLRRYMNKVFAGLAKDGKGTMGWCNGFKMHLIINDKGEILNFMFTPGNVDDREPLKQGKFMENIKGKLCADKGYIGQALFDNLFLNGIQLVTKVKNNMKNSLMGIADKILLRKRALIETVNDELKNIAQIEHSRHRSFNNFIANSLSAIAIYCFFEKKPAIDVNFVNDGQLLFFRTHVK